MTYRKGGAFRSVTTKMMIRLDYSFYFVLVLETIWVVTQSEYRGVTVEKRGGVDT